MNLSRNLMMIFYIFMGIKESTSNEHLVSNEHYFRAALPLIQKENPKSSLRLAIPYKYDRGYAVYWYDKKRSEKLKVACPAPQDDEWITVEKNFKSNGKLSEDGKLFVMKDYSKKTGSECSTNVTPSIKKVENVHQCGHFEAELYDVGYPNVRFASMYQLCYSKMENRGTQYTIHRIKSPNLLLTELWKSYETDPTKILKSSLNEPHRIEDMLRLLYGVDAQNYYPYQLVGFQDMPINSWEITTLFHFNFVPITKNIELLMGMMAADNYIRLYSKKKNEQLTLYSGAFEIFQGSEFLKRITSIWRIIMDNEDNAIIIVTQQKVLKDYYFICKEKRAIVRKYKDGCTYTCAVDEEVIKLLGLPQLEIKEMLDLTLAKEVPANVTQSVPEGQQFLPSTSSQRMGLSDFLKEGRFMEALKAVDAELARNIKEKLTEEQPWIYRESLEPEKYNAEDENKEYYTEIEYEESDTEGEYGENNTEGEYGESNTEGEYGESNTEVESEESNIEIESEESNIDGEFEENSTEGESEDAKDWTRCRRMPSEESDIDGELPSP